MSSEELIQLMVQFNISRVTVLVYSQLLTDGPLSVARLVAETRESSETLNRSLRQLLRLRLVSTDRQRGRLLYYAADPSLAWLSLIADLVWKTTTTLKSIRSLPETDSPTVESLRMLCADISDLAQRLYKPQAAALKHKERDAETLEELARLTCEIIYQAQKQISAVSKTPRQPQVSSFWAVLTSRIEAGVQYSRVVDLQEVVDHGLKIVSRDIEAYGIDLRVLEQARIRHKFYIVDRKLLAVYHQGERSANTLLPGVGRITNQPQIIERYRKRFDKYSKEAIPGHFVVPHMRSAADELLQRARAKLVPIEVQWLEDLIDYGKFSRFHVREEWSEERHAHVKQRALVAGLVRRTADGFIVPAYPTDQNKLREAYTSASSSGSAHDT